MEDKSMDARFKKERADAKRDEKLYRETGIQT